MESKEVLFTVAGLVATFLLPWPNGKNAPPLAVPSDFVGTWELNCTAPTGQGDASPHQNAVPVRVRPSPDWGAKRT